jgi:hypothetical protein
LANVGIDACGDNPDVDHMYFEALKWGLGMTEADVTPRHKS